MHIYYLEPAKSVLIERKNAIAHAKRIIVDSRIMPRLLTGLSITTILFLMCKLSLAGITR